MFAPSQTATKVSKESAIIHPAIRQTMCAQKRSAVRGEDRQNEEGAIRDENSCLYVIASTKATSVMLSKGGDFLANLDFSVLLFTLSWFSIHQRCCLSHESEGNIPLVLAVKEKEDNFKTDEED